MTHLEKVRSELLPEDTDNIGRVLSDVERCSTEMIRLRESAYRRGYQQGMAEAVRMLERGFAVKDVRLYMENEVARWRNRRNLSTATLPPIMT